MSKGPKSRFHVDIMALHPEVTGSSILCIVSYPDGTKERILVDCGLFQEKQYLEYNTSFPWNPESIDAAILTHVHVDHCGRFPLFVKKDYRGKIYMSEDSKALIPHVLFDSEKVIRQIAKKNNQKPLYAASDVERTIDLAKGCKFEETIQITGNIKMTLFMNGHIPGAAIVLLQINCENKQELGREYGTINLLFTGDYRKKNQFFDVMGLPNWVKALPITIVTEATYGDVDSSEIYPCYEENIVKYAESSSIILPVLSLQRAQEILYSLRCMQIANKLSKDIPIYLDGKLAIAFTKVYTSGKIHIRPDMLHFFPENLTYVSEETRPFILKDRNPKIIVTTSGMASFGPAQLYLPEFIKRANSLIHFTCYCAEGTLGRRLKDAQDSESMPVAGFMVNRPAKVEFTSEFSAHAKADEMVEFLQQFSNVKFILVNHGACDKKDKFAKRILKEVHTKDVGILGRDYMFRVGPYGVIKSMTTKFI